MSVLAELDQVVVVRDGRAVLDGAWLRVDKGERLAVVGANGAGKTTLLRTIVGLQPVQSGTVTAFGEVRRSEKDFHAVRLRAAYLFQDSDDQLFCPTVVEDVAFGPLNMGLGNAAALAKARGTLEMLNMLHLADRITRQLSGGEKKLVCLAGILAMDPDLLLLDEPTSGLDAAHLQRLIEVLDSLDTAMIIVSHERQILDRLATRALILRNGRLEPGVVHRHPHLHDHVHVHSENEPHTETAPAHAHTT